MLMLPYFLVYIATNIIGLFFIRYVETGAGKENAHGMMGNYQKGICCPQCGKKVINGISRTFDVFMGKFRVCPYCGAKYKQPVWWSGVQLIAVTVTCVWICCCYPFLLDAEHIRGDLAMLMLPHFLVYIATNMIGLFFIRYVEIDADKDEKVSPRP